MTVADLILELVGALVASVRRVLDLGAGEGGAAVGWVGDAGDRERVAFGVAVVDQDVEDVVYAVRLDIVTVAHRIGRVVDVLDRDGHRGGVPAAVAIGDRVVEAVGARVVGVGVACMRAVLDVVADDAGRAVRGGSNVGDLEWVVGGVGVVGEHVDDVIRRVLVHLHLVVVVCGGRVVVGVVLDDVVVGQSVVVRVVPRPAHVGPEVEDVVAQGIGVVGLAPVPVGVAPGLAGHPSPAVGGTGAAGLLAAPDVGVGSDVRVTVPRRGDVVQHEGVLALGRDRDEVSRDALVRHPLGFRPRVQPGDAGGSVDDLVPMAAVLLRLDVEEDGGEGLRLAFGARGHGEGVVTLVARRHRVAGPVEEHPARVLCGLYAGGLADKMAVGAWRGVGGAAAPGRLDGKGPGGRRLDRDGDRRGVRAAVAIADGVVEAVGACVPGCGGVLDVERGERRAAVCGVGGVGDLQAVVLRVGVVRQDLKDVARAVLDDGLNVVHGVRHVVDVVDGHGHLGGVRAALAVAGGVGEGVGACRIRIGEVGVRGVLDVVARDGGCAVGRVAHVGDLEGVAVVVGVVAEDVDDVADGVLVHRGRVVAGLRLRIAGLELDDVVVQGVGPPDVVPLALPQRPDHEGVVAAGSLPVVGLALPPVLEGPRLAGDPGPAAIGLRAPRLLVAADPDLGGGRRAHRGGRHVVPHEVVLGLGGDGHQMPVEPVVDHALRVGLGLVPGDPGRHDGELVVVVARRDGVGRHEDGRQGLRVGHAACGHRERVVLLVAGGRRRAGPAEEDPPRVGGRLHQGRFARKQSVRARRRVGRAAPQGRLDGQRPLAGDRDRDGRRVGAAVAVAHGVVEAVGAEVAGRWRVLDVIACGRR